MVGVGAFFSQFVTLTKLGRVYGIASDVRPSVRPSVCVSFPKQISETHGGFISYYTLEGVDVPFGVYDL